MTEDDEINPWAVYDAMGVPHLERFLDEGADFVGLDLTDEDVQSYAVAAATRWHGPALFLRNQDSAEVMAQFFAEFVIKVCALEDEDGNPTLTMHDDGRVTLDHSIGGTAEVTEQSMRHWQWMFMLFAHEELAERFLAAVPERIRAAAMERATSREVAEIGTFYELMFPVVDEMRAREADDH